MKRKDPFTVVYGVEKLPKPEKRATSKTRASSKPKTKNKSKSIKPKGFLQHLRYSTPINAGIESLSGLRTAIGKLTGQAEEKLEAPKPEPIRVGVWDLGAWLGRLPALIERMNEVQSRIVFYNVRAVVPVGFVTKPERMQEWLRKHTKKKLTKAEVQDITYNLVAEDFFGPAEAVRRESRFDYIVGITPSMVAGIDEGRAYYNHFSTFEGRTVLTSTFQLREFASKSQRSVNAFLARIIVSQLFVAMHWPKLGMHDNTGCMFDYDANRSTIIEKIINPKLDDGCRKLVKRDLLPALEQLMELIRSDKDNPL